MCTFAEKSKNSGEIEILDGLPDAWTPRLHGVPSLQEWQMQGRQVKLVDLEGDEEREWLWKTIESQRAGFIGRQATQVRRALEEQRGQVLDVVRNTTIRAQILEAVEGAFPRIDGIYERAIGRLYREVWPTFAAQSRDATQGKTVRVTLERKQDEDAGLWRRQAEQYVQDEGGTLIRAPNEHTKESLRTATQDALDKAIAEGWGSERIAREIEDNTGDLVNRVRGRRIARTEIIRASNRASLAGARRTTEQTGKTLKKEWIGTMDDRIRETHLSVDGSVVPLNSSFTVGGFPAKYPSDPSLPPRESILCRCTLAYLTR